MAQKTSEQTQNEALAMAKKVKVQGQKKEQTKLIAKGIEKGIFEYKKQQKIKSRERDKAKKQQQKAKLKTVVDESPKPNEPITSSAKLAWALLVLSWLSFAIIAVV